MSTFVDWQRHRLKLWREQRPSSILWSSNRSWISLLRHQIFVEFWVDQSSGQTWSRYTHTQAPCSDISCCAHDDNNKRCLIHSQCGQTSYCKSLPACSSAAQLASSDLPFVRISSQSKRWVPSSTRTRRVMIPYWLVTNVDELNQLRLSNKYCFWSCFGKKLYVLLILLSLWLKLRSLYIIREEKKKGESDEGEKDRDEGKWSEGIKEDWTETWQEWAEYVWIRNRGSELDLEAELPFLPP